MEIQIETILTKITQLSEDMKNQAEKITTTVTENLTKTIDEKMKLLTTENQTLLKENKVMKERVTKMDREIRANNVILHGIPETENNKMELLKLSLDTLNIISKKTNTENWDKWEVNKFYRLGKKTEKKNRPILVSVTTNWRKMEILRNNKLFPDGIYATDDLPKEVLAKRRELAIKLKEELGKGNTAYISYDRLIVKEATKEKRKRSPTKSPPEPRNQMLENKKPSKINKISDFIASRASSSQTSE
ncbi:hypothetical protein O0L34_g4045 [Tuta absoluta]|nr:hypothetical protein O0L34_g4045 [Tuta absoluta]